MKRRDFIKSLAAASLCNLGRASAFAATPPAESAPPPGGGPSWVEDARRELPACRETIYLQTGTYGPTPARAIRRVGELLALDLKGPAAPRFADRVEAEEDACRPLVARLTGAREEEVALTHNATEGINIVLWSIDWKAGDEIVVGNQEHPALMMPCYNLRDRFGVRYRKAAVDRGEDVVANVLAQLSDRTRLVAMSHVSRRSGRVMPVRELAAALHRRGVRLLLDGAQAAGNVPVDFGHSGCDYYSLCGHKWLMGPKGTGALLVRRELLPKTPVSYTGAHSFDAADSDGNFTWHPNGRRYEYGARSQSVFGGWAETMRWLDGIGLPRIQQRIQENSLRAARAVEASGKYQLVSSPLDGERSGIIVVRLPPGTSADEVTRKLDEKDGIIVCQLENPRDLRISFHFFNTWGEFSTVLDRLGRYC